MAGAAAATSHEVSERMHTTYRGCPTVGNGASMPWQAFGTLPLRFYKGPRYTLL